MNAWTVPALVALGSYLLGSIPFGLILAHFGGAGDLRAIGSGNIGATNVLRTGRKGLAAATLALDAAKGAVAVLIAERVLPGLGPLAGVFAFYGHLFPVWLRFRGGKGIATYLGIALALFWPCGLTFAIVWLAASLLTRHSSIGGIGAALLTPVCAAYFFESALTLMFLAFGLTVLWTHRANIVRLFAGTEPRIGDR
ncbi:glycerol-3-phosphate 1-O-acyltransferase PlsY [Sphingomonas sp. BIUV-7]|uniref:Glycerol-3-phosphate acyltransferase n=1 Tax=Sphingomonas natans TaxID=3063330 RepID=A0ABT8YES2_9SPHN|nr:glycerol-3-phosphate 1-O-acyltransferase PlsY [Sphingomonas sp. BIUV-7]MDO6416859.1 glycerol-3-phosphate 1-O-acyltransferase PlsY [Sphingomonas sp. BIUV-7]